MRPFFIPFLFLFCLCSCVHIGSNFPSERRYVHLPVEKIVKDSYFKSICHDADMDVCDPPIPEKEWMAMGGLHITKVLGATINGVDFYHLTRSVPAGPSNEQARVVVDLVRGIHPHTSWVSKAFCCKGYVLAQTCVDKFDLTQGWREGKIIRDEKTLDYLLVQADRASPQTPTQVVFLLSDETYAFSSSWKWADTPTNAIAAYIIWIPWDESGWCIALIGLDSYPYQHATDLLAYDTLRPHFSGWDK